MLPTATDRSSTIRRIS